MYSNNSFRDKFWDLAGQISGVKMTNNSHIKVVKGSCQFSRAVIGLLGHCRTFALCNIRDSVDRLANLLEDIIAVSLGCSQLRVANIHLKQTLC
jgi:hypothetical protein